MSRNDALVDVLSEFARTLLTDLPLEGLLEELVRHAVDLLPIDSAGVSLISPGTHPRTFAGSDDSAVQFERLQHDLDEGPCRVAHASEDPVLTPDLAHEERFPRFAREAQAAGLRAVFAFPLRSANRRVGALDLYRTSTGPLEEDDQTVAQTLAHVATAYLLNAETRNARADFVASISHELRTPMTSVVGYGEMLGDQSAGSLTPRQRVFLDAIVRNGQRAQTLAGDLLVLATLDSGVDRPHEEVDLTQIARGARDALAPVIASRGLRVDFEMGAEPVRVRGVADELERVAVNLMSNAIKFTDDHGWGRCRVVELPPSATRGAVARLEVSDNGIGIPVAEQAGLFRRFFRSSTAESRQIQGTGLGLNIVESIVRHHGGEITVVSEHLQGSTFTVDLPCVTQTPAGAARDQRERVRSASP